MTDRPEFFTPWWRARMSALATRMLDGVPDDFLAWPEVADCGLTTANEDGVAWEVERWGTYPKIDGHSHWLTQAHHGAIIAGCLAQVDPVAAPGIVEFGGGFGSMAHIANTYRPDVAWVTIDSEPMLALQRRYLGAHGCPLATGVCCGATFLTSHDGAGGFGFEAVDVFIGTWSVSEATEACHDWLIDHDWFGAPVVFLAADLSKPDDFGDGCGLVKRLEMIHAFDVVESPFPGSVYVTRGFAW